MRKRSETNMALNALLKRQAEIKTIVTGLGDKFKEVSDANRKETYFSKRLNELKSMWDEFEDNHVAIEEIDETTAERLIYEDDNGYKSVLELMKKAREMYETAYTLKFPNSPPIGVLDEREKPPNRTILVQDEGKKTELIRKTYAVRASMLTELGTRMFDPKAKCRISIAFKYKLEFYS